MKKQILIMALLAFGMLAATETKAQEEIPAPCGLEVITKGSGGVNTWVWQPGVVTSIIATQASLSVPAASNYIDWQDATLEYEVQGGVPYYWLKVTATDTVTYDSVDQMVSFNIPLTETTTGWQLEECVPKLIVTCKTMPCCSKCKVEWGINLCQCDQGLAQDAFNYLLCLSYPQFKECYVDNMFLIWTSAVASALRNTPH